MLPFPFFCIGCCTSQTTKLNFNNSTHILTVKEYCGYCLCCASNAVIDYANIYGVEIRPEYGTYINHQQAFRVFLMYKDGEIPLSGKVMFPKALVIDHKVKTMMNKCGIKVGMGASSVQGMVMPVNVVMY